jgi:hypothetical protein
VSLLSRLSGLFGGQSQPEESARLVRAEQYVESQWTSGLTRHYDAEGVIDSVQMKTGVVLKPDEAVEVVEKVRARHGWGRRDRSSYFPPVDEE